jgi:uncharacterized NAD(P)/FAD-binding protein YdhS
VGPAGSRDDAIVVIGGGCSGLLVAANLLRLATRPIDIVILEPADHLGGLAYRTSDPRHLLNSPAREMSAFSSAPSDFVDWLAERGAACEPTTFAPRHLYGEYLRSRLVAAREHAPAGATVTWIREEATALSIRTDGDRTEYVVGLHHGSHLVAREVVLALGVPAPRLNLPEGAAAGAVITDPWVPGALERAGRDVLLVGTGLTMIDTAISLSQRGATRQIIARSRHGFLPHTHLGRSQTLCAPAQSRLDLESVTSARSLLRMVREAAEKSEGEGGSWQDVIAAFRPHVSAVWNGLAEAEQARIQRHLMRYWEIHRHRIAPESACALEDLQVTGRIDVGRGNLEAIEQHGERFTVRLRAGERTEQFTVDSVIDCTGPARDYATVSRLAGQLVSSGVAHRGRFGLGFAVDADGDLLATDGTVHHGLHTIGWARRGALIETTAVPELRTQAEALAARISS